MIKLLQLLWLLVEATLGLLCVIVFLVLLEIWRGTFPPLFLIGYLGMPRRYHPSAGFHPVATSVTPLGLLTLMIVVLIDAFCFKDVVKQIRKLRQR